MLEIVVLVGLQASGKSTWARDRFAATHVIVSKDAFPNAKNKARRQVREIDAALAKVRVDPTRDEGFDEILWVRGPLAARRVERSEP
jgi:hypothetical protein